MTHASLFSGIGGFDLAAHWAGWTNLFNCEINPFCQQILKHHFPNATQYSDIKATDFTLWRGRIDVLTGGFPCQPFSVAGKRKGTDDDRYLWPEMLRAIREISPRFVVGENVRGIINWSNGLVFEQVCSDLEALGYEVTPFLIPACGVNAPHRRYRVWFIAHHADAGVESLQQRENGVCRSGTFAYFHSNRQREWSDQQEPIDGSCGKTNIGTQCENGAVADAKNTRLTSRDEGSRQEQSRRRGKRMELSNNWQDFPTQSPVCSRDDGLSGRLDGITFPKWRSESIKGFGNAVVPQIPYQFFKIINRLTNP